QSRTHHLLNHLHVIHDGFWFESWCAVLRLSRHLRNKLFNSQVVDFRKRHVADLQVDVLEIAVPRIHRSRLDWFPQAGLRRLQPSLRLFLEHRSEIHCFRFTKRDFGVCSTLSDDLLSSSLSLRAVE